ncbi:hypothetical protein FOA52_015830 [Chlamydomonas sp. UWO 241]|nr:hypothetical protein FOA52_015830 [Chlamydomonas sp. UWO 241]
MAAAAANEGMKQDQSSVQEERPSAANALQALHTLVGGVGISGSTPHSNSSPTRGDGAADADGGTFPRLCHAAARVCGMHVAVLMAVDDITATSGPATPAFVQGDAFWIKNSRISIGTISAGSFFGLPQVTSESNIRQVHQELACAMLSASSVMGNARTPSSYCNSVNTFAGGNLGYVQTLFSNIVGCGNVGANGESGSPLQCPQYMVSQQISVVVNQAVMALQLFNTIAEYQNDTASNPCSSEWMTPPNMPTDFCTAFASGSTQLDAAVPSKVLLGYVNALVYNSSSGGLPWYFYMWRKYDTSTSYFAPVQNGLLGKGNVLSGEPSSANGWFGFPYGNYNSAIIPPPWVNLGKQVVYDNVTNEITWGGLNEAFSNNGYCGSSILAATADPGIASNLNGTYNGCYPPADADSNPSASSSYNGTEILVTSSAALLGPGLGDENASYPKFTHYDVLQVYGDVFTEGFLTSSQKIKSIEVGVPANGNWFFADDITATNGPATPAFVQGAAFWIKNNKISIGTISAGSFFGLLQVSAVCYNWSSADLSQIDAGVPQSVVCASQGPTFRFTQGNNANTPGCGTCWCCELMA